MRRRRRGFVEPVAAVDPEWSDLVDRVSGRVRLVDPSVPDVAGLDVDRDEDVEAIGGLAASFFSGGSVAARVPAPSGGGVVAATFDEVPADELAARRARRIVEPAMEVEPDPEPEDVPVRPSLSLFGDGEDDEDDDV